MSSSRHPTPGKRSAPRPPSGLAKLTRPEVSGALLRPRLLQALERSASTHVTWLHAPGGAGKSTLLSSYLEARGLPFLWYRVDRGDADGEGSAFLHYLRLGVEQVTGAPLALPAVRPLSPAGRRAFARRYFEALALALPEGLAVVLDDFQKAAADPVWLDLVRQLITVLPPQVRIFVASRIGPPDALADVCGKDQLRVLDRDGLRFDEAEIDALLHAHGEADAERSAAEILALSDGWAIAVALLTRTEQTKANVAARPIARALDGSLPRRSEASLEAVFTYLAEEVVGRLDAPSRELLLDVCLCPTFSVEMVDELTGRSRSAALLARLHEEHRLLDQDDGSFRMHDLLRRYLLAVSREQRSPARFRELSERAARLLAARDQLPEATELLATIGSHDQLAALVEQHAPTLAAQGRLATIADAISRLPPGPTRARPWVQFWEATCALGRSADARRLAESAFHALRAAHDAVGSLLAWSLVLQSIVLSGEDFHDLARWLPLRDELPPEPPSPDVALRVALAEAVAYTFFQTGMPASFVAAERALSLASRHGTSEDRILASSAALLIFLLGGMRERAEDIRRVSRAEVTASPTEPLAHLAYLHSEAIVSLAEGSFETASQSVEAGLVLAQKTGLDAWTMSLLTIGVLASLAVGDLVRTQEHLDTMRAAATTGPRFARSQYAFCQAWIAFERGDVDAAIRWQSQSLRDASALGFQFGFVQDCISGLVFHATRGNDAQVRELEAHVARGLGHLPCPFLLVSAQIVAVYAALCRGEDVRASLARMLLDAKRESFLGGVFFGTSVIARVATHALELDLEPTQAARLLRARRVRPSDATVTLVHFPYPLKIRALGPLWIELDGVPIDFGRKTPAALLSLLRVLLSFDEMVPLARVSSALWASERPRSALDTAIHRLRKLLGREDSIESRGGLIGLAPSVCWSDVRALPRVGERIRELTARPRLDDRDEIERLARRLADLARGPFGEPHDPPVVARARAHLERCHARALADLDAWNAAVNPAAS